MRSDIALHVGDEAREQVAVKGDKGFRGPILSVPTGK